MTQTPQVTQIQNLQEKLDRLIRLYQLAIDENNSLKIKQEELIMEKTRLLEKTTLARTRVEAMISRLKAMEQNS
jgi:cell division protein ZapB